MGEIPVNAFTQQIFSHSHIVNSDLFFNLSR